MQDLSNAILRTFVRHLAQFYLTRCVARSRSDSRASCRDIASNLSKVADFNPPHLHLAPRLGVIPVEFRGDLWHQKTRVPALSCGVVCVILRFAVLVKY